MRKVFDYANPLLYFGTKDYSIIFPLITSLMIVGISEFYAYQVINDPVAVGRYIIFVNVTSIIYFSFRNGIRGGQIATFVIILYYLYIVYNRNYTGETLNSAIETTVVLGSLYLFLAYVIGSLKQRVDYLIEQEADEKKWLQTIIDQLPVGVVITDSKGRLIHGNKQVNQILGKNIRRELVAGKYTISHAKLNGKQVLASQWPLAQALATGKPVSKKEFVVEKENGKKTHIQISASVIKNGKGNTVAAASIISDITEQKENEIRKDDFVSMASHELKTPITGLKLYVDLLIRGLKKPKDLNAKKALHGIKYQMEKLQELVFDLLDVSRITTGKLSFNKEKLDLNQLVKETVNELQKTTLNHKIKFNYSAKKILVYADRFRIYQVLTNIIQNAIKYSPDGGKIVVKVTKEATKALASIQDVGIGINKGHFKKIFERLYQITEPVEKTFPGLGMGLYISQEIIKKHKGKIWVNSIKGKGSTFFFSLPLNKY